MQGSGAALLFRNLFAFVRSALAWPLGDMSEFDSFSFSLFCARDAVSSGNSLFRAPRCYILEIVSQDGPSRLPRGMMRDGQDDGSGARGSRARSGGPRGPGC